ncbi:unnamed protein product [Prorocentrum cordatum]|uniref:Uncharacterized protein n=1 Tax=Prorocentrum cordatum TaxID=2364126 RepID=A0ABN9QFE5_9DINO|nr:unnamed protein product [Polarella glacialis]
MFIVARRAPPPPLHWPPLLRSTFYETRPIAKMSSNNSFLLDVHLLLHGPPAPHTMVPRGPFRRGPRRRTRGPRALGSGLEPCGRAVESWTPADTFRCFLVGRGLPDVFAQLA